MLMNVREAAEYLRISPSLLNRLRSAGQDGPTGVQPIPYIRLGGRTVRYRKADLDRWLNAHEVDADGAA